MSSLYSYKHHTIPFHEWKRRINPNATRKNKEFNAPDNVVWLTLGQHIQVHELLFELNRSEFDRIACWMMAGRMGTEEAQRKAASAANRGKVHTKETRLKMSVAKLGNKINLGKQNGLGTKRTEEYKLAMSKLKLAYYAKK